MYLLTKWVELKKFILIFWAIFTFPLFAATESREILCLYDSREEKLSLQPIYRYLGIVYDYLGLQPEYHDINSDMPTPEQMKKYRAVLSWFQEDQLNTESKLTSWLIREHESGRKLIFWNTLGLKDNSFDIGIEFLKKLQLNPVISKIPQLPVSNFEYEKEYFDFERKLQITSLQNMPIKIPDFGKVLLKTKSPLGWSTVSFISDKVSFALSEGLIYQTPQEHVSQWQINPYHFLSEALDLKGMPAFDISTLNGYRIYFSQLDGDGSLNLNDNDTSQINPEYFYDHYLNKYTLPFTVSCIEGEVLKADTAKWIDDPKRVVEIFKKTFLLPSVEPAAHGFSHPMDWGKGITALSIPPYSRPPKTAKEKDMLQKSEYAGFYIFDVDQAEWEKREILGSIKYIQKNLCPPGKKVKLFLWTGNCSPSEHALRLCRENNILNLNGGEYRYDKFTPSCSHVPALHKPVGREKQVLAGASNEMLYTQSWTNNYEGFLNVLETFKRTGSPRRLKPVDVYLHFFTIEKKSSAAAVHKILTQCSKIAIAPIFAGEYAAMGRDYPNAVLHNENGMWKWEKSGAVPSLRFEGEIHPDLNESKGILGYFFDRELNSTYVHLDGSGEGLFKAGKNTPQKTYLQRSNAAIKKWEVSGSTVSITAAVRGRLDLSLAGVKKDSVFEVTAKEVSKNFKSDSDGILQIKNFSTEFGDLKIVIKPAVK